jgi:hypothetical protein
MYHAYVYLNLLWCRYDAHRHRSCQVVSLVLKDVIVAIV